MSVSVLILTLNEETNLATCLDTVKWCDDVVVLDSFSADKTIAIAAAAGARVVQRKFDDWAAHQNWATANIAFKHPWVFYLDADERMTEELRAEIEGIAESETERRVAFYCGRKNFFMGRWLKHAMPPGSIMRFFRPEKIRFERLVNPTPVINGAHGYLKHCLLHYNFSKGLTEWIQKHNQYSLLEAMEGVKLLDRQVDAPPSLCTTDRARRRQALKSLSFRLPCRPFLKFFYLYFFKRGILDGRAGLTYCTLQAIYEYMIVLKILEIRHRGEGPARATAATARSQTRQAAASPAAVAAPRV
jgi:glycosyltransferase involved in cell wall biosynthesis